jgi:hypothetical protein
MNIGGQANAALFDSLQQERDPSRKNQTGQSKTAIRGYNGDFHN